MFPDFVLPQEEWEEHQKSSIVDHPPYVNVPLHPVLVTGVPVYSLGNQHGQFHGRRHSDGLWDWENGRMEE